MAQDAGVDLSAISRQFPSTEFTSKPQKPHCCEEKGNQQQKGCSKIGHDANSQSVNGFSMHSQTPRLAGTDSGEETEVLRFSFSQTFSQLMFRKDSRIQILLTEGQQQAFNTHFKPLLPEQVGL
jgi:hypothetical protein